MPLRKKEKSQSCVDHDSGISSSFWDISCYSESIKILARNKKGTPKQGNKVEKMWRGGKGT